MSEETPEVPTPEVEDDVEIQGLDSDYDVTKDVETQDEEAEPEEGDN